MEILGGLGGSLTSRALMISSCSNAERGERVFICVQFKFSLLQYCKIEVREADWVDSKFVGHTIA